MKYRKAAMLFGATIFLASCAVPTLGTVTPAPNPPTADPSPAISQACRDSLNAVDGGASLVNAWDTGMAAIDAGALADPVAERENLLEALVWGAEQVGVTDCG